MDGSPFEEFEREVRSRAFVQDFEVGLIVRQGRAQLAYTHVYRAKEFETQDDPHLFGVMSLTLAR